MRFRAPYWHEPRYVKRFAILPIKIDNEIVWLETVYIRQEYRPDLTSRGWYNERFVSKEEYDGANK